jgi:hypothetical protein
MDDGRSTTLLSLTLMDHLVSSSEFVEELELLIDDDDDDSSKE